MSRVKVNLARCLKLLGLAAAVVLVSGSFEAAHAQTDMLPFVCPNCVGKGPQRNRMQNTECFYTTGGNGRFRIAKSCNTPGAYEDYTYDNTWLYHRDDTTWMVSSGQPKCTDGSIAYNTYLNKDTGAEGGAWYKRWLRVGETFTTSFYVQPRSKNTSLACQVPEYDGPASHTMKLVSLETMDIGGPKQVARLAVMDGAGKGENYWYATDLGWIGYEDLPACGLAPDAPRSLWSISCGTRIASYDGTPVATSNFAGSPGCGRIPSGQGFFRGQQMRSCNGVNTFAFQADGNLVAYGRDARWATMTNGRQPAPANVIMQKDGNFVMYDVNDTPIWASGTHGQWNATLDVQDDCNNVMYNANRTPVWHTNTYPCR
jgi:predicted heme/steroid binding protein